MVKKEWVCIKKRTGKLFLTDGVKKELNSDPISFQQNFWEKILKKETYGKLQVWINKKRQRNFESFLEKFRLEQKKYVVFHPSASPEWKTKLWTKENWIILGKSLLKKKRKKLFSSVTKNSVRLNSENCQSDKWQHIRLIRKNGFFLHCLANKKLKISCNDR